MLRILYPQDEPGTESDDVWRMVALDALIRLDARAAGFPPPRQVRPSALPAPDPLRDLLAVRAGDAVDGAVRLVEVLRPGSGLSPGDRIVACDGQAADSVRTLTDLLTRASAHGRVVLELDQDRRLSLVLTADGPRLERLDLRGSLADWEGGRRWALPAIDGAWSVSGSCDAGIGLALAGSDLRAPPGSPLVSGIAGAERTWVEARRSGRAGSFACAATPLRGAWRRLHLGPGQQQRLCVGARAGQALVVESSARNPHLLQLQGPGSERWGALPAGPGLQHRVLVHGAPGAMAAQAVESNGMVVVTVASASGDEADIDLRILLPPGEPAP